VSLNVSWQRLLPKPAYDRPYLVSATLQTRIEMCSLLSRNAFCCRLGFGIGSPAVDPELGEKK